MVWGVGVAVAKGGGDSSFGYHSWGGQGGGRWGRDRGGGGQDERQGG